MDVLSSFVAWFWPANFGATISQLPSTSGSNTSEFMGKIAGNCPFSGGKNQWCPVKRISQNQSIDLQNWRHYGPMVEIHWRTPTLQQILPEFMCRVNLPSAEILIYEWYGYRLPDTNNAMKMFVNFPNLGDCMCWNGGKHPRMNNMYVWICIQCIYVTGPSCDTHVEWSNTSHLVVHLIHMEYTALWSSMYRLPMSS